MTSPCVGCDLSRSIPGLGMRRFLALLERTGVKPIDMTVSDVINVINSYITSTKKSMPTLVSLMVMMCD